PLPEGVARVPALYAAVEVVPMVEHAAADIGGAGDVEMVDRLARLQQPEESERTIEHADVGIRGDDDGAMATNRDGADEVALRAQPLQIERQALHQGRRAWGAEKNGAVLCDVSCLPQRCAQQACQP